MKLLAIAIEIKNVPSTVVVAADVVDVAASVVAAASVAAAAISIAGVVIVGESISPASGADHYVNCVKDKGAGMDQPGGLGGWMAGWFSWVLLVAGCCGDCCG